MKSSFSNLLGTLTRGAHTLHQIKTTGVSVKKEDRGKLSTSDLLKLSKAAREGGVDNFSFFEADRKVGRNFKAVWLAHAHQSAVKDSNVLWYESCLPYPSRRNHRYS